MPRKVIWESIGVKNNILGNDLGLEPQGHAIEWREKCILGIMVDYQLIRGDIGGPEAFLFAVLHHVLPSGNAVLVST